MGIAGGGLGAGMGGMASQSAFTSPGLDPMTLALLLRMQNAGVAGATPGAAGGLPGGPQFPQGNPQIGGMNPMMGGMARPPMAGGGAPMPGMATASPQQNPLLAALAPYLGGQGLTPGGINNLAAILGARPNTGLG